MEILAPFFNRDDLIRHVSKSMSTILSEQDSTLQANEMKALHQFFDALPSTIHLDPIPVACQLFDYFLQHPPSIDHSHLLSSCLNLLKNEDRLQRIRTVLMLLLDHEQSTPLRDALCKLLPTIDPSSSFTIDFDWTAFETVVSAEQHDWKYFIYVWRFMAKHHPNRLEEILKRILSEGNSHDELSLLLIIELRSTAAFLSLKSFWLLIQRALADPTSNNDRIRKCALFLLKEILNHPQSKHIQMREETTNQFLILINDQTQQFWMDFIVIYEALEDGIVHLIRPLLTKFDRLLNHSYDHGLSLTWIFILLQRLFVNASAPLGRWTVRWFLNSMKFPDRQVDQFFLDTVIDWLSNNLVFLKGDEINETQQSMEQCLESFFDRWLSSHEERSRCLLLMLTRFQTIKWSHLSLVRVLHSLRSFAVLHQHQAILNDEHVKQFTSLIITQFHTFAPVLRLAAYSSILDTVIYLVDWSIAKMSSTLLRFFSYFDRSTFLSKHFPTISTHFPSDSRKLQGSIEEFLNAEGSNNAPDTRLFSIDTNLLESRQIIFLLDLLDTNNTDQLKTLFYPLLENIRTAHQRPYMSINHVRRSIELFTLLIQESYFHSSNFVKDWLSSSLRSVVREGLAFIKLHSIKQPVLFAQLPTVFLMVGNHGDITRFLQELITQMETSSQQQQQTGDSWLSLFLLFAHAIHWLLKHRWADFHLDWENKFRPLPLFSKLLSILEKNSLNSSIPQVEILIAKYLLISDRVPSPGLSTYLIDDCFKASAKELPYLFPALGLLLHQPEISSEQKSKLIEDALHIINEFDHRIPFYWSCFTQLCQAIAPSVMDTSACDVLIPWFEKILDKSGQITGMMNAIIDSIVPIWLREHRLLSCHLPVMIDCILFRQTYLKDKRQLWQAEQSVEQDESYRSLIVHTHTLPDYRYDRNVRIVMQLFLLHIWPSLLNVQQHELVQDLIKKHRRMAFQERRPRFCTNSLEHRLMFRSLQCLLCLTSVIKDPSLLKTIYDYMIETLMHENEPSLRLLAEWILVRLIAEDRRTHLNDLYEHLQEAHCYRTGAVCSWISVASHLINLFSERTEQIEYLNRIIDYISPLIIHSNFHIRTFSCSTMIKIIHTIERLHLEKETPYQAYRWFKRNDEKTELGRYTNKLQNLFLFQFDPMRDFSLETIFYTLPKLSLVADDEFLLPEWFMDVSQQFHLTFPISVHNRCTILQGCQPGIWRLTAAGKGEQTGNVEEQESSSMVQHKANPYPTMEPLDDTELRITIQRTQLIVVASLIDKQTNLGGLCRTGEIFGVKEMVIGSLRVLDDPLFLNLSMTAHKWLRLKQVHERELKDYLIDMQTQGYTIVAVEQTVNSQNLYEYAFPEKTLLLLGNEREGIRADLLSLVDATVEIPQAGVIRSLNVHVSGALCISEYARKYLNLVK